MSLIVTNESKVLMLEIMLNKATTDGSSPASNGDRKLKLFVNNLVPTATTVIGDVTECSATGYSTKTLTGASWSVSTVDGVTSGSYSEQTFDIEQAATIYGYYVTNYDGTELLWIERFTEAPYALPSGGGSIGITLNFTLS